MMEVKFAPPLSFSDAKNRLISLNNIEYAKIDDASLVKDIEIETPYLDDDNCG